MSTKVEGKTIQVDWSLQQQIYEYRSQSQRYSGFGNGSLDDDMIVAQHQSCKKSEESTR